MQRVAQWTSIDRTGLSPAQCRRIDYFVQLETSFNEFRTQAYLYKCSEALWNKPEARDELLAITAKIDPDAPTTTFAKAVELGGRNRGEIGFLYSLNTRFRPHLIRARQVAGLEPVRLAFGPTVHDPLAQGAGRFTFYADPDRRLWHVLGAAELGKTANLATLPAGVETAIPADLDPALVELGRRRTGLLTQGKVEVVIAPMAGYERGKEGLPTGEYHLTLLVVNNGQAATDLTICGDTGPERSLAVPAGPKATLLRTTVIFGSKSTLRISGSSEQTIITALTAQRGR
jgi:hypothetical protein